MILEATNWLMATKGMGICRRHYQVQFIPISIAITSGAQIAIAVHSQCYLRQTSRLSSDNYE